MGDPQRGTVVGDGQVFIASSLGRFSQLPDRMGPIAVNAVHVEVTLEIPPFNQPRKSVLRGRLNLSPVLSEFWGHVAHLKKGIQVLLPFSPQPLPFLLTEVPVFIEQDSLPHGDFPEAHIMRLGPGEVGQRSAVALRGHHPEVHLEALGIEHAGLGLSAAKDLADVFELDKCLHNCIRGCGDGQEVQISYGLLATPETARRLDSNQSLYVFQHLNHAVRQGHSVPEVHPGTPLPKQGDPPEHFGLTCRSHSGQGAQASFPGGSFQSFQIPNIECIEKELCLLGAHPLDVHQLDQPLRDLLLERLEESNRPGLQVFLGF